MLHALFPHLVVEALEIPVMAVEEMAIQISALFAKGDEVLGVKLERRRKMKRHYMVDLEPLGRPAPLAFGLVFEMLFLDLAPLRAAKMNALALKEVLD